MEEDMTPLKRNPEAVKLAEQIMEVGNVPGPMNLERILQNVYVIKGLVREIMIKAPDRTITR